MTDTKTINTAAITPDIVISDDVQLTQLVHEAASLQLSLNRAETIQQAAVEAAKKAFEDATRDTSTRIAEIFTAIQSYCAANRDRLFPAKNGKRAKTYQVLAHKLQYRSSDTVQAPEDAVQVIENLLKAGLDYIEHHPLGLDHWNGYSRTNLQTALKALIRQPEPELNKDAVKNADHHLRDMLATQGIRVLTQETFKLAFTFTPDQA